MCAGPPVVTRPYLPEHGALDERDELKGTPTAMMPTVSREADAACNRSGDSPATVGEGAVSPPPEPLLGDVERDRRALAARLTLEEPMAAAYRASAASVDESVAEERAIAAERDPAADWERGWELYGEYWDGYGLRPTGEGRS